MEKSQYFAPDFPNKSGRNGRNPIILALITAIGTLIWWKLPDPARWTAGDFVQTDSLSQSVFNWSQITPSAHIDYHDCFNGYQCARIEVPMDYHRTDGQGRKFALALVRIPAKVPVTDPQYGGAVLINPGGPGASGVGQALYAGPNLRTIMDADVDPDTADNNATHKYFDILGFDPRGVNNTTPGFSCFPDLFAQMNWELQLEADGFLGTSSDAFMRNWQRSHALAEGCSGALAATPDGEDEDMGSYINTPPTARDMVEIIERHGEWREKQGKSQQQIHDRNHGYDPDQSIAARTRWNRGQEKLQFWGRSYGTVLGVTFATMFPERVNRMVLDGVVNTNRYYHGTGVNAVIDADAIFERFFLYCDQVGPDVCALYRKGGVAAIRKAYDALEERIFNRSMAVPASATRGPEVITATDLKNLIRFSVYQPMLGFPLLAEYVGKLAQGDGSAMADFKQSSRVPFSPSVECLNAGPWSRECKPPNANEAYAMMAILCSDAFYLEGLDEDEFVGMWDEIKSDSSVIGDYWAQSLLPCAGWKTKGKWIVDGPYTGNTSHPLLFVSNTLDPVTPLDSAHTMSKAFPGSSVLQQDSEGHTSATAPSLCIAKGIRTYFQTGELPVYGTLCNADMKPLLGHVSVAQLSPQDQALYAAMVDEMHHQRAAGLPL